MILIRADGNAEIGTGHIMRCLSIADALREKGQTVLFVTADEHMQETIGRRGYEAAILYSDYRDLEAERGELLKLIHDTGADGIFIDSYFVTPDYLQTVREQIPVAYLDDLGSFGYPADLLINYNVYGPGIDYRELYEQAGESCPPTLLGPKYAPLRRMFRGIPKRVPKEKASDILVSGGGSDPAHIGLRLIREVPEDGYGMIWHFLIGGMNPDYEEIRRLAEGKSHLRIHHDVADMRSLISGCDIAIAAAGSTMYEIAACGTPMITYTMADNQRPGAKAFQEMGMAVSCGDLREGSVDCLLSEAIRMAGDYALRKQMGEQMQEAVDGRGAERICNRILRIRVKS